MEDIFADQDELYAFGMCIPSMHFDGGGNRLLSMTVRDDGGGKHGAASSQFDADLWEVVSDGNAWDKIAMQRFVLRQTTHGERVTGGEFLSPAWSR